MSPCDLPDWALVATGATLEGAGWTQKHTYPCRITAFELVYVEEGASVISVILIVRSEEAVASLFP